MTKRKSSIALPIIIFTIVIIGIIIAINQNGKSNIKEQENKQEEITYNREEDALAEIESLVLEFGKKLQMVSLLNSEEVLKKNIEEHYSTFISPSLLEKWLNNVEEVPGRMLSSPWPDRIEIHNNEKITDDEYEVKGEIIEITSAEKVNGGAAAIREITLIVKKINEEWLIDKVILGDYQGVNESDLADMEAMNLKYLFPLKEGNTWQYRGEGNEYATFSREILFIGGDRVQFVEDNGGTVSASIFEITEKSIKRIFFNGEEYDKRNLLAQEANDDLIILMAPVRVGTKWETQDDKREIVEIDAKVDTPIGKFKDCIKVKINAENSTMYEYYKMGIGLVKREFISEGMSVTSTLEGYNIN